jgi:O-antigen/teichoic acid export membrane protein
VLPELTALSSSGDQLESFVKKWTQLIWAVAFPGSLLLFWVAPYIVAALYGKNFADTGRLAGIMLLAIPFVLTNSLYFNRAIALRLTTFYVGAFSATAVLTLILDLSFGRALGPLGVAAAIVIRESVMFLVFKFSAGPVPTAAAGTCNG